MPAAKALAFAPFARRAKGHPRSGCGACAEGTGVPGARRAPGKPGAKHQAKSACRKHFCRRQKWHRRSRCAWCPKGTREPFWPKAKRCLPQAYAQKRSFWHLRCTFLRSKNVQRKMRKVREAHFALGYLIAGASTRLRVSRRAANPLLTRHLVAPSNFNLIWHPRAAHKFCAAKFVPQSGV